MSIGTLRILGDREIEAERRVRTAQGFFAKRAARKAVKSARKASRRAAAEFRRQTWGR